MHRTPSLLLAAVAAALIGTLPGAHAAPTHAIGLYGPQDIKLGPNDPFPYANPDAPKGGHLNMRSGNFTKLNPVSLKGLTAPLLDLIFENATVKSETDDEPATAYGHLVESIVLSDDHLSMVYKIRPEARFSDGQPVTAADFVFSFEIMQNPEYNPVAKQYFADIKSVTAVDAHTVKYEFARQNQELPLITGEMTILPKHVYGAPGKEFGKDFDTVAVGSGPYVIDKFEFGKFLTVRRNPEWWGRNLAKSKGCHNFDTITAKVYLEDVAMKEAFKGGEFDALWVSSSKDWALDFQGPYVQKNYIVRSEYKHSRPVSMQGFVFNLRRPQFQSLITRYAIAEVFDFAWSNTNLFYRQYTRTRCFFENSPDLTNVAPPTGKLKDYLQDLRDKYPRDKYEQTAVPKPAIEKPLQAPGEGLSAAESAKHAQELLESAGWMRGPDGMRKRNNGQRLAFELLLYDPMFQRVVEPFKQRLAEIGVDMTVNILQPAEYEKRERAFDYDMVLNVYSHSRSPGNELIGYFGSQVADTPGSQNLMGLKNPAVDAVLNQLVLAKTRAELAFQAQALDHILTSSALMVPNWHLNYDRTLVWNKFGQPRVYCSQRYFESIVRDLWWADPAAEQRLKEAMGKGEALPKAASTP